MIKDKIFSTLPYYFIKNDTYRDNNGKGILQRFLEVIGEYFDYLIELADNLLGKGDSTGIINPVTTEDEYLNYIADYVGNPPMLFNDDKGKILYRQMLRHIVTLYHWKGTIRFYKALFKYYGLTIEIEEELPSSENSYNRYDDNGNSSVLNYDYEDLRYDDYEPCLPCSVANVYITGLDELGELKNMELHMRIARILDLYRPINTIFNVFIVDRIFILGAESGDALGSEDGNYLLAR